MADILDRLMMEIDIEDEDEKYIAEREKALEKEAREKAYTERLEEAKTHKPLYVMKRNNEDLDPINKLLKVEERLRAMHLDPNHGGLSAERAAKLDKSCEEFAVKALSGLFPDAMPNRQFYDKSPDGNKNSYLSTVAAIARTDDVYDNTVHKLDLDKAVEIAWPMFRYGDIPILMKNAERDIPGEITFDPRGDGGVIISKLGAAYIIDFGDRYLDDDIKQEMHEQLCPDTEDYLAQLKAVNRVVNGINANFANAMREQQAEAAQEARNKSSWNALKTAAGPDTDYDVPIPDSDDIESYVDDDF